jgi:hypothetical protein
MAKNKPDPVATLAEAMLTKLDSIRAERGNDYPPRLGQLAEISGLTPTHDQILKAAAKKAFTQRAVVTEKVEGKPSLDSYIYIKGDEPSPIEVLAKRMVAVLESQRRLGSEAYPPLLRRLADLCLRKASDAAFAKAAVHPAFTAKGIHAAWKGKKPDLDAPIMLREDLEGGAAAVLPALLRFALSPKTSKSKGKTIVTTAFTSENAKKRVGEGMRAALETVLKHEPPTQHIPGDLGWVFSNGEPLFFLLEHLHGALTLRTESPGGRLPHQDRGAEVTPVPVEFAQAFRQAFDQFDRRNGYTNFVKLVELRQALTAFPREAFDACLHALRADGEFTLNSHEGLHGPLTPEEREAGVHEAGSLLVYASRR